MFPLKSNKLDKKDIEYDQKNILLKCIKPESYCFTFLDYFRKVVNVSHIDFIYSYSQVLYCFKPREIYEIAKNRKYIKNQWSRDDPGFLIILIVKILISTLCYCMTLKSFNFAKILQIFTLQGIFSLILLGLLIAFILKKLSEKYLKIEETGFHRTQTIEYMYAFDIHCNSFVPFYFFSNILEFIFLPITFGKSLFSTLISNTLFTIGILFYMYVTLKGYYALPFIRKNKSILLLIWPVVIINTLLTLLNINILKGIWLQLLG